MRLILVACHILAILVMPFLMMGLIQRTKALWTGRKGPRIFQGVSEIMRLLRKRAVYAQVTTPVFRISALSVLITTLTVSLIAPMYGAFAPLQFKYDFLVFAYTLGLGRVLLMLSAMDTASAFEAMGASREASFSALAEPALFLLLGGAALATGNTSLATMLGTLHGVPHAGWIVVFSVLSLFILLQVETARVPVDDPLTHLELTMIHEVMILDHSALDLAAMQHAAALKLTIYAGMIAAIVNPYSPWTEPVRSVGTSIVTMAVVAIAIGCVESLVARLRMKWVPRYVLAAALGGALSMLLTVVRGSL
jgi:formate hydrogenlyase subunit 4